MTLLHMLRKQFKWKDKEAREPEGQYAEMGSPANADLDSDDPTPQALASSPESTLTPDPVFDRSKRPGHKGDSASATVIKTLIHMAATSDEGYERDRAILSITGGNNIVDALKILVDPAFLVAQAASTNEIYDITDSNGRNVAHYAVSMGNLDCVKFLASEAPRLFALADSARRTPAYIAAALGQSECLRVIARSVPDSLLVTDSNGVSPAHASALQGELECINIVTECAPHLFYEREASGKTPAHIAVFADMANVVEAIAKAVPDSLKVTDGDQLTPAHIAIMYGKKDCLRAIERYAAESMRVPSGCGTTAEQMLGSNPERDPQDGIAANPPKERDVEEDVAAIEDGHFERDPQPELTEVQDRAGTVEEEMISGEISEIEVVEEDEIAMLRRLLKGSLQLETFLDDLRQKAEFENFEQDNLGIAFRLKGGSVLAMANNGVIFSAIHTDNESSTTILVQALTGGVGKVVEE